MENLDSFIKGMPKAELHVHVEGTLEPELKFELAGRNNLDLPYGSAEDMRTAYAAPPFCAKPVMSRTPHPLPSRWAAIPNSAAMDTIPVPPIPAMRIP